MKNAVAEGIGEDLIDTTEARRLLRVNRRTMVRRAERGLYGAVQPGGKGTHWKFSRKAILAALGK